MLVAGRVRGAVVAWRCAVGWEVWIASEVRQRTRPDEREQPRRPTGERRIELNGVYFIAYLKLVENG